MRELGMAVGAGATVFLSLSLGVRPLLAGACAAGVVVLAIRSDRRGSVVREGDRLLAVRQREEQVANTAHELRTPLTAMTTAIELLREGYATSPEDSEYFLEQAAVSARHMGFLINDIVDLASLENGRLSLHNKAECLGELLDDTHQVMRLTASTRGIAIELVPHEDELVVYCDRSRVLQVSFNLVANAIKYSAPGDTVQIRVIADRDRVRIEVTDRGPGVPPDMRDRLFTRFGRAHRDLLPAVPGTGLGLFVCKLLVQHMGGAVGFRPADPKGSVFWFELRRLYPRGTGRTDAVAQTSTTTA